MSCHHTHPVAGLDPWAFSPRTRSVGIHVFVAPENPRPQDVGARVKPGQGEVAYVGRVQ
jgi:hypothetical protein